MFFGKRNKERAAIEAERERKIAESQRALLAAAVQTADAAQDVTQNLKRKLDEIVRQFETTTRILKDALIICNADGNITTFNPAAEMMFGLRAKEAIRQPVLPLFGDTGEPIRDVAHLWSMLQSEDQDDLVGRHVEGREFPIRATLTLLDRSDGSNAIMVLVHDRTALEAAKAVEVRYHTLFETSFDGIVIVEPETGELLAANPAIARIFGCPVASLMGKPISALVADKDRERVMSCTPRVGGASEALPQHFMAEGLHASGRLINLVFTMTEIEWEGGAAILATAKDVTEMRRLENMVSMKRDNGIDMVCCFDPAYRITFVNDTFARSVGQRRKDLLGQDVRDFMDEDDRASFTAGIRNLSPQMPSYRSQVVRSLPEGGEVIQDWIDHATFDADGDPVEFQRVGRDIAAIVQSIQRR